MIKKILSLTILGFLSAPAFAGGGCCSGHGGVAQCGADGYKYCVDGSRSPTCTCTVTPDAATKDAAKPEAGKPEVAAPTPAIALPPKSTTLDVAPMVGPVKREEPTPAPTKK